MAKILHIDDEKNLRDFVSRVLADEGHEVISAEHGIKGLELLASVPDFNIIFLDYNHKHPQIDGYKFAKEVRENPAYADYKDIPIIGTSDSFPQEALHLLNFYLSKPFTFSQLRKQVDKFCKK
ncbi:TPA: response regulator [Candidatus Woesearchaeota archaeon]|nr:response regulator [Candidatus Woesearchaeota archaeon]